MRTEDEEISICLELLGYPPVSKDKIDVKTITQQIVEGKNDDFLKGDYLLRFDYIPKILIKYNIGKDEAYNLLMTYHGHFGSMGQKLANEIMGYLDKLKDIKEQDDKKINETEPDNIELPENTTLTQRLFFLFELGIIEHLHKELKSRNVPEGHIKKVLAVIMGIKTPKKGEKEGQYGTLRTTYSNINTEQVDKTSLNTNEFESFIKLFGLDIVRLKNTKYYKS